MLVKFKIHGTPASDATDKVRMLEAFALVTLRDTFTALGVEVPVSAIAKDPKKTGYWLLEEAWQAVNSAINQATLLLEVSCGWDFIPTVETAYDDVLAGRCLDAVQAAYSARAARMQLAIE